MTSESVETNAERDVDEVGETAASGEVESAKDRIARYARTTKARADEVKGHATERIDQLESERERHPFYDVLFAMRDDDDRIAGREMASAIAYRLFFLMLPLVLVVVGGLGFTRSTGGTAAADAVRESGASAAVARDIAAATSELSIVEHLAVLVIGLFGTYLAGLGLIKTLGRVNATAWGVRRLQPANKLRLLGIVLALLVVLIMLSSAWNQMRGQLGVAEFLLALPVVGVVYAIVIVVLHAQLPRPDDVPWRDLIPGALLVGISVAAMQAIVLGYVARKLSSSNELYGGIGTAIALLFWLYLLGRVLVLGPLLDVVLWRRKAPDR